MRRATMLLSAAMALAPAPLAAQVPIVIGTAVRISHSCDAEFMELTGFRRCRTDEGRLSRWDADSVFLRDERGSELAIARADVSQLYVSGERRSHLREGAVIGAVAGAAVGGLVALATTSMSKCSPGDLMCVDPGATAAGVFLAGAVLGAIAGALLGASAGSSSKTERWVLVPFEDIRVYAAPQLDVRFVLGMTAAF